MHSGEAPWGADGVVRGRLRSLLQLRPIPTGDHGRARVSIASSGLTCPVPAGEVDRVLNDLAQLQRQLDAALERWTELEEMANG